LRNRMVSSVEIKAFPLSMYSATSSLLAVCDECLFVIFKRKISRRIFRSRSKGKNSNSSLIFSFSIFLAHLFSRHTDRMSARTSSKLRPLEGFDLRIQPRVAQGLIKTHAQANSGHKSNQLEWPSLAPAPAPTGLASLFARP
jgi:hypothetical protein